MRKFFPVFIDLTNKRCLVVGGGKVAERKVKELLRHGADVTVVSPELTSKLQKLRREKKFPYVSSNFKEADLLGFFLVVDATGSSEVHKEISLFAGRNNILVNIVSAPHFSDFFTPAIFSRGDLKIAVSTSGKSPALAAKIKKELSRRYGPEYSTLLNLLGAFRKKVVMRLASRQKRKKVFNSLVESDIIDLITEGKRREAVIRCESIIDAVSRKSASHAKRMAP